MSRSKKHTPYSGMKKDRFYKRYANRKIRRKKLQHNFDHKDYRKDFCCYDICDFYWIETPNFDEYYQSQIDNWYQFKWGIKNDEEPPTREECWKEYQKIYIRK